MSARRGIAVFVVSAVAFACSCNKGPTNEGQSVSTSAPVHPKRATGLRIPDNLADISTETHVSATKLLSAAIKSTKNLSVKGTFQHPDFCDPSAETFSFRTQEMVTDVKDQGECGACWAFATNAVLESSYRLLRKENISASEQDLISCSPEGLFGPRDCQGGWWAFDVVKKPGIESSVRYPYVAHDAECASRPPAEFRITLTDYVQPGQKVTSVPPDTALKTAMCKHGPLAVGFDATPTFTEFGWNNHSSSSLFAESDSGEVNHGIALVGWDKDGWLIKNSWGKTWGDQGFLRVKYGTNSIGWGAAWAEAWPKDYDPPQLVRALIDKPVSSRKKQ